MRGKRGNIVQVYPAIEYDFVPNNLELNTNDLLHIQWTGSNTHVNGAPGGDGQTGDAGEGRTGTDRSNLVQIIDLNENFPLPYEQTTLWKDAELLGYMDNNAVLAMNTSKYLVYYSKSSDVNKDLSLYLATSGHTQCFKSVVCGDAKSYESIGKSLDADLNNAPASVPGVLIRFNKSNKIYNYMCSRNNNFSNRSQKASISVN